MQDTDERKFGTFVIAAGPGGTSLQGIGGVEPLSLAQAISASEVWEEMQKSVLIVRSGPNPAVVVLGAFDESDRWRLKSLRDQLERATTQFRYISYSQAEKDCEELANRLLARFGREKLMTFTFMGLPRGGYIVLGILSYLLNLPASSFAGFGDSESSLVVVDDCAISGRRFGELLRACEGREVILATLYSPRDLGPALEAKEQVVAFVNARDLHDHAPAKLGDKYPAWRERWMEDSGEDCYWVGQTDYLCFAWNEPDTKVWNPVVEKIESGWRITPPELCLKNRFPPDAHSPQVQVLPEPKGPLRPGKDVVFGELEGQMIVANALTNVALGLSEVAGDIWQSIVEQGNISAVVEDLLGRYEVDEVTMRDQVDSFVQDLSNRGFLEEGPSLVNTEPR